MMRHLIILLMLAISASLSAMAQDGMKSPIKFIRDNSYTVDNAKWDNARKRCRAMLEKYDVLLTFQFETEENFDKADFDSILHNWAAEPESKGHKGAIFVLGKIKEKECVHLTWNGYGEVYDMGTRNGKWFDVMLSSWNATSVPRKMADLLECFMESKPLLDFGNSLDEVVDNNMTYYNHVIDISGLFSASELGEIEATCRDNKLGKNMNVAVIFAPSFNKVNLEFMAKTLVDKFPGNDRELILINEYNCEFVVVREQDVIDLGTDNYLKLQSILGNVEESYFLSGERICTFCNEYLKLTYSTQDKINSFGKEVWALGLCCHLPIGVVISLLIGKIMLDKSQNKQKPRGPRQYIKE